MTALSEEDIDKLFFDKNKIYIKSAQQEEVQRKGERGPIANTNANFNTTIAAQDSLYAGDSA